MSEQLSFKIEGEFITNLVRSWFWNERRPYEVCEELLLNCLCTDQLSLDERKELCVKIIEGRLRLVGVNEFELIDDNENVRPLYQMINKLTEEKVLRDIEDDIQLNAINYIDTYSTVKSYRLAVETLHLHTLVEVYNYFGTKSKWYDSYITEEYEYYSDLETSVCKYGLWLLDKPKLIYEIWGKPLSYYDRDKFFRKLYDYLGPSDYCHPDYRERQLRYESSERVRIENENQLRKQQDEAYQKAMKEVEEIRKENARKVYNEDKDTNDMTEDEYADYLLYNYGEGSRDQIDYSVRPDDIERFEGLIDPQGNFYSCTFGGHNIKAYHIMKTYYKRFGFKKRSDVSRKYSNYMALDPLVQDFGWIAVRDHSIGGGIFLTVSSVKRPTKTQINRIYDDMEKHNVKHIPGLNELVKEL